ncbi:unnamed protein product [Candida verbasci]|uniref:Aminotransferase class I/classII large domain-containing protein n=1 Tax=Candida verbasci TaxID=1227364 RepID=A0A9W4TXU4_9ASCO|nr:unnamed protein product [Candida verbasci]
MPIESLISKRASGRTSGHFTQGPKDQPPKGFKPHSNPLALSYGTPNDGFFPIDSIDINLVEYPFEHVVKINSITKNSLENLHLTGSSNGVQTKTPPLDSKNSVHIERHTSDPNIIDLSNGLQYANVAGHRPLLNFTKEFIKKTHNPNYSNWDSILTTGASDGLNKACDAILDKDDVILIEEFTFAPFLRFSSHTGAKAIPIKLDLNAESQGINYEYLKDLLENWPDDLPKPKALYTIATGQNPIGTTQTLELRNKIYELAVKHDFIIIEDDPYGYLTLPKYRKPEIGLHFKLNDFITIEDYLQNHLTPSYLELDTEGRVIRVETFSKLFAPGLRLGFVIAHEKVINAIRNYSEIVNRGSSGLSQLIVNNVIQQHFKGVDGWLQWIFKMRLTYSHRKDLLLSTIFESEAYNRGLVDVIDPKAGMFATLKINFPKDVNVIEKMKLLEWKFIANGVLAVPSFNMAVDKKFSENRCDFFRLCYAPANDDEELIEGGQRLVKSVLEFFDNNLQF